MKTTPPSSEGFEEIFKAIDYAVRKAVKEVGIEGVRDMSWFPSSHNKKNLDQFFKYKFGQHVSSTKNICGTLQHTTGVITGRKLYQPQGFRSDACMVYYLLDPYPEYDHDEDVWVLEETIKEVL